MAEPILIDLSNYDTLLKESTASRSGSPDGNIFFDVANGKVELITKEELAQVNLGSGLEDNPLTNQTGIFIGALYAFERQQRRVNEFLRKYDFYGKGTYKYAGAYELVNGRLFSTTNSSTGDDRKKLRGSGWLERNADGDVTATYFGVRTSLPIEELSQPYYQLTAGGAPTDFAKDGDVDEAIAVTTPANYLSVKVRTYGNNYDEKTLVDGGIAEMSGFSFPFALGESPHLTSGNYDLADVYGGSQIAPWTGMSLEKLASPQNETGFNEGAGDFTWILHNVGNGNLDECVAFLDALAQTDDDIDSGELTVTNGKRVSTWYTYNPAGKIVTRSGAGDGKGLFIENIPTADEQKIIFTADDGDPRTYPFTIAFNIVVGVNANADLNGWYHVWEAADYGTPSAVTVLNADDEEMKGSTYGSSTINQTYDANDGPVNIVVECEGDGIATQAKTEASINVTDAVQTVVCSPGLETNV